MNDQIRLKNKRIMTLGIKIKNLRIEQNLTQDDLTKLIGGGVSYVWNIENGEIPKPSAVKLSKIAEALKTTIEYLINDELLEQEDTYKNTAFFRKYNKSSKKNQEKIEQILTILEES